MRRTSCAALLVAGLASPATTLGQQAVFVGSELDHYLRVLELVGLVEDAPLFLRPVVSRHVSLRSRGDSIHPWSARYPQQSAATPSGKPRLDVLEPALTSVYLSAYPRDINNGAVWTGRGASGALNAGVRGVWGPVTVTLYPSVYATSNEAFRLPAPGDFRYPWRVMDLPLRFGDEAYGEADWGQSSLRLDLGGFTAGFGTENMWWGPAVRNPILMSNTAPGFPHLDLGTGRPVTTFLGRAETRLLWGRLGQSAYFSAWRTDPRRYFVGATAALEPKWLPGLTLGLARAFQTPWDSVRTEDLTVVFQTVFKGALLSGGKTDDVRDQALSLYGRWLLPLSGFEAYVEWSRTDHSWDLRDFLLEPEHSRAYTLGLAKAVRTATSIWCVRSEFTQLERPNNIRVRGGEGFYTHNLLQQGYTHRGQMLGAAIGPGATSSYFSVDRYSPGGRLGAYAEWVRYDNDAYYDRFTTADGHDVELTLGLSAMWFVRRFNLGGVLAVSRELNRYFEVGNDVTNLRLETRVAWRP